MTQEDICVASWVTQVERIIQRRTHYNRTKNYEEDSEGIYLLLSFGLDVGDCGVHALPRIKITGIK